MPPTLPISLLWPREELLFASLHTISEFPYSDAIEWEDTLGSELDWTDTEDEDTTPWKTQKHTFKVHKQTPRQQEFTFVVPAPSLFALPLPKDLSTPEARHYFINRLWKMAPKKVTRGTTADHTMYPILTPTAEIPDEHLQRPTTKEVRDVAKQHAAKEDDPVVKEMMNNALKLYDSQSRHWPVAECIAFKDNLHRLHVKWSAAKQLSNSDIGKEAKKNHYMDLGMVALASCQFKKDAVLKTAKENGFATNYRADQVVLADAGPLTLAHLAKLSVKKTVTPVKTTAATSVADDNGTPVKTPAKSLRPKTITLDDDDGSEEEDTPKPSSSTTRVAKIKSEEVSPLTFKGKHTATPSVASSQTHTKGGTHEVLSTILDGVLRLLKQSKTTNERLDNIDKTLADHFMPPVKLGESARGDELDGGDTSLTDVDIGNDSDNTPLADIGAPRTKDTKPAIMKTKKRRVAPADDNNPFKKAKKTTRLVAEKAEKEEDKEDDGDELLLV